MSHTRSLACCMAWLALALGNLGCGPAVSAAEDDDPLTDEAIVVRFVGGATAAELIELIRSKPVAFDLSPEMLEELRAARLPEEVIEAMVARQAEMDLQNAPPDDPPAEDEQDPAFALTLRLHDGEDDKTSVLRIPAAIGPQMAANLGLAPDVTRYTQLGLVVACLTQDHVPDHWRGQSPLGRDFVSVPRHRVLEFLTGELVEPAETESLPRAGRRSRRKAAREAPEVTLELPELLRVDLEPQTAHDLLLGVAVQAGDRFYLFSSATREGLVLESDEELEAEIRIRAQTVTVRFP